ncbi:ABC transporter substrate-binding protein [Falsiroseomonas selenitidurans]|uniref:ABC transporter substrate-binding protein n=1 Tax=Falsiroseomonas selenitidurans TaxID=2716335 RepID=A0ABX1DX88_9PROT|nr:substrate-binding domain-containing protein [Falsiroseomonas selenitidurans]NKC29508.1 ABC transporter substrate-binding protein [Falsiroseomonas selenitidurans]
MTTGRLVLLSAAERPYCEALLRGFARRHPGIDVDFVFGISTALHNRYLAEHASGGATADLVWSSAMDQVMGLVLDGHAQPHGVAHALPPDAAWQDLALATTREPVFNLVRGAGRAGSFGEVAAFLAGHPGAVAVPDIAANGLGFLALLRASLEDPDFEAGMAALAARRPARCGSAPALVAAMTGGGVFALQVLGAYALRAVAADTALRIAESDRPAPAVARLAFIPRRAANPDAARAFLAHMVSEEGQAALAEGDFWPVLATPPRPIAPIPLDSGFARLLEPARRAALLHRWQARFAT